MKNSISSLSRIKLVVAALLLIASLFVPIWSISLDAPQYPEGLSLQIWAHKIAGDVDIINGLNHYIGMKTLHTEDFQEFKILPYLIPFYALLFITAAVMARKKWLYSVFGAFVLFGIIALADFWKWEYDYGHNLDPNAAIKVPGMAYQPPLIGFKQLLNFGAYSVPDAGGWMFLAAGILLLAAILNETGVLGRLRNRKQPVGMALGLVLAGLLSACDNGKPESIQLHKDACDFCKMSISDARFMTEVITRKGRVYKFDDLHCMLGQVPGLGAENIKKYYVGNYEKENDFLEAETAWYVSHPDLKSPMGGNVAAFATKEAALARASALQASVEDWSSVTGKAAATQHDHHAPEH